MNTEFLLKYRPQDDMFTSFEEMHTIRVELGLTRDNLQEMRNDVVKFYSSEMNKACEEGRDCWGLMTAMQSVTAVIDHYKFHLGQEV